MAFADLLASWMLPRTRPWCAAYTLDDVRAALKAGLDDFSAMPTHVMLLVIIYPIIGLVIGRVTIRAACCRSSLPLHGRLRAARAPSRRSRRCLRTEQSAAGQADFRGGTRSTSPLRPRWGDGADARSVQVLIFVAWIAVADLLYTRRYLASVQPQLRSGVRQASCLTTPAGWALIVLGNGIGFLFAVVALTLSVVSFPLLLDRPVGASPPWRPRSAPSRPTRVPWRCGA